MPARLAAAGCRQWPSRPSRTGTRQQGRAADGSDFLQGCGRGERPGLRLRPSCGARRHARSAPALGHGGRKLGRILPGQRSARNLLNRIFSGGRAAAGRPPLHCHYGGRDRHPRRFADATRLSYRSASRCPAGRCNWPRCRACRCGPVRPSPMAARSSAVLARLWLSSPPAVTLWPLSGAAERLRGMGIPRARADAGHPDRRLLLREH